MRPLWMGIRPTRQGTQLLGMRGSEAVLQACLKHRPHHRQALGSLLESLALWEGAKVHAAVCADAGVGSYDGELWGDLFAEFGGLLYELEWVGGEEMAAPFERADGTIPGDFGSLLELRLRSALERWPR